MTGISFGPAARNRLSEAGDPSARGAELALESFCFVWLAWLDGRAVRLGAW